MLALAGSIIVGLLLPVTPALAATPAAGLARYASDSKPLFPDVARSAQRNQYVILNFYEKDKLRALKAANPHVKVLVYKNAAAISSGGSGPQYASGIGHPQALADALGALLDAPERRASMAAAGRRLIAERFSPAAMIDAYEALYRLSIRLRRR